MMNRIDIALAKREASVAEKIIALELERESKRINIWQYLLNEIQSWTIPNFWKLKDNSHKNEIKKLITELYRINKQRKQLNEKYGKDSGVNNAN